MTLFKRHEARSNNIPVGGGSGTFNPFDRPTMPLSSVALDGALGTGGGPDTLASMGIPTAYRCISLIANVIASCVLESIDRNGDASPWMDFQNLVSYTSYEITELIVVHMAGWGNFYAFPVTSPGRTTKLLDLQPIYPGNVSVLREGGRKIFRVRRSLTDMNLSSDEPEYKDYNEDEVFHIPFLGYDGLKGVSPVDWAAQTFATTLQANTLAGRFMQSGQQLGGIVSVRAPLADQDQADAIKESWQKAHGGVSNAGTVAVLDAETTFTPITINPDNLQLIQGRTWQAQEVARVYGVPLTMLSFDSTGYGDAIETQQEGFVTYTVRQYTDRAEQRLARWFQPRGKSLAYDLDGLMRGSTKERYANYATAINAGWLLRSEARDAEKMIALPSRFKLAEPIIPNNMVVSSALPETVPAEPVEPPEPDDSTASDSSVSDSSDSEGRSMEIRLAEYRAIQKTLADQVYHQLAEDYPKASLDWVHHASWEGPLEVPFSELDMHDRANWRASSEPENVASFADRIKRRLGEGKTALKKPAVLVAEPGKKQQKIVVDGHHRVLGSEQAGQAGIYAWVGHVNSNHGPWMELHDLQFTRDSGSAPHSGDDKAADQVGK